jgi:hypothetical protein
VLFRSNVTITDANGCTGTNSAVVENPNSPTVVINLGNALACFGDSNGQLIASASGGTAPYGYQWNNSATTATVTGLLAGVYSVVVTDAASCIGVQSYTLNQPDEVVGTIAAMDASCNGSADGELDLTPAGGDGNYTYEWDDVAMSTTQDLSGLTAATYMVTITDGNGCTGTASGTVTEPSALSISATPTDITTGNNGAVSTSTSGGSAPYSYSWTGPGGFMSTNENLTGLTLMGLYEVTVTDNNGCTATANGAVNNTTGLAEVQSFELKVFPNPSNGIFTLNSSITNGRIIVRDALGREILTQQVNSTATIVNLENQGNGIYFIELRSGDISKSVRVVIAK